MFKNRKIIRVLFSALISLIVLIFVFQSPLKVIVRDNIPEKVYLRLSWVKNILTGKDFGFYKYEIKLKDQYKDIASFINNNDYVFSVNLSKKNNLNHFELPPFFPGIGFDEVNTAYIDFYKQNLFYVTKNGMFFLVDLNDNELNFNPVKTNISNFLNEEFIEKNASINYFNSYTISKFGIKDILIDNDQIYVSYLSRGEDNSYNTSIIKSQISDSLTFENFFSPKSFISSKIKEFSPVQSGGRITSYKKDSLLFSIGDFRERSSAQNLNLDNGKIIAINKKDGKSRIVSYGHRNPQGLDYSKKYNYILSSEHGPAGGDEINFNNKTDETQNFGWPIASYGVHYSIENAKTDAHGGDESRIIKGAPIYKSHKDYGFVEPIKYFEKNPAVSEVKLIKEKKESFEFFLSTLGNDQSERPLAKHLIHYRYDLIKDSIEIIRKYNVGERIRDISFNSNLNRIYYVGESTGILGYINLKSN